MSFIQDVFAHLLILRMNNLNICYYWFMAMSQKFSCINCNLFYPWFVWDEANLLHFHSHDGDSNNKIIAMMVGGSTAVAAAFHNMDSCDNHHDNVNNLDNNDNSLQSSNRKLHVVHCFETQDVDFITDKQRRPFTPTTCCQIHYMGLNLGLFFGCPKLGFKTWWQK